MTRRLMKLIVPNLVWNQETYGRFLEGYVSKTVRWLDAGCGWRLLATELESLEDSLVSAAATVVGTDVELASLAKHRNISYRACASLDALPFSGQSFDLITCNMVVEHLERPERCFAEMARVLAPNGALVIHTPNLLNYLVFANHTLGRILPRSFVLGLVRTSERREESDIFPTYYRANSVHKLRRTLEKANLRLETVQVIPGPQPFFGFFAPLAWIELLWMKATMSFAPCFGSSILIACRTPEGTGPTGGES
jgi:2-polyprenyl-3-methyl-5-hydroxy-6-metoxy-1,4-benzoquinol methylase